MTTDGLRLAVGTSLIGAKGKTPDDQLAIDLTAVALCGIWSPTKCVRYGRESRR